MSFFFYCNKSNSFNNEMFKENYDLDAVMIFTEIIIFCMTLLIWLLDELD